jgi:hypothetical protein
MNKDPKVPIVPNGKNQIPVKQLAPIKMKDAVNRNRIVMNLTDVFGFLPEILIIDKVLGSNNTIQIAAVIPEGHHEVRKKGSGVEARAKKTDQGA